MRLLRRLRMHPDQLVANDNFNRWAMVPACTINHLALGSIFAWSVFNDPLTRVLGVAAPSHSDWLLSDVSPTFSLVMGGFAVGAFVGKYIDKWGPRASVVIGSTCFGTGFLTAA